MSQRDPQWKASFTRSLLAAIRGLFRILSNAFQLLTIFSKTLILMFGRILNTSVLMELVFSWSFSQISARFKSSHRRCSVKKSALKNFYNIHRKMPALKSLFNKVALNFIKKRLQHNYFPMNIGKIIRTPILKNICERLLL